MDKDKLITYLTDLRNHYFYKDFENNHNAGKYISEAIASLIKDLTEPILCYKVSTDPPSNWFIAKDQTELVNFLNEVDVENDGPIHIETDHLTQFEIQTLPEFEGF